jgi:cytochrome P450
VRTANRALFGEELARSKIWQEVSILYSIVMFYGADVIRNYPELLKGSVLRKRTDIERVRQRARDCLVPILKRRLSEQAAHKEKGLEQVWESQKPTDMIQWVLDADPSAEHDFEDIVLRMLHITVAAVHTTTFTFVEVLHCMAVMPEWLDELREEAIGVLREEQGWSKNALAKLRKLDSFCNEAARVCPLSAREWQSLKIESPS